MDKMLKIDVGVYNNKMGKSYNEIASESRSMHKSQAFGSLRRRGSEVELLVYSQGVEAKKDIMEGIETSWKRVRASETLTQHIKNAQDSFQINRPYKIIDELTSAYKELNRLVDRDWRAIKKNEIKNLIKACSGLFFEALSSSEIASVGEEINISFDAINRSPYNTKLEKISILGEEFDVDDILENNKMFRLEKKIKIPINKEFSEKYWLVQKAEFGTYKINDQKFIGDPDNSPSLSSKFVFRVNGQEISYDVPDNDPPKVSFSIDKDSIDEDGGVAKLTITLSRVFDKDSKIALNYEGLDPSSNLLKFPYFGLKPHLIVYH